MGLKSKDTASLHGCCFKVYCTALMRPNKAETARLLSAVVESSVMTISTTCVMKQPHSLFLFNHPVCINFSLCVI